METTYQDMSLIEIKTYKRFVKNPRSSISSLYRSIRKDQRFCYLGDYPIIATIVRYISVLGIETNRPKISYVLRQSPELSCMTKRDKNSLLDLLLETDVRSIKTQFKASYLYENSQTNINSL